jgi:predicted ArsR family transcriptional regulator
VDALAAIGDPALRETLLWVRRSPAAVTADEVAAGQGIHRNVARSRLERLADAGLLLVGFERRSGKTGPGAGRPAKTYAVAPELTAAEFPARRYERLLGLLLETLPERGRSARLHEVGVEFGRTLLLEEVRPERSARAAADSICASLRELGYQAAVEEARDGAIALSTPTCPLRPLVATNEDATEIDRGMWVGLVAEATGADASTIRCELHDCLDRACSCRVHIQLGA